MRLSYSVLLSALICTLTSNTFANTPLNVISDKTYKHEAEKKVTITDLSWMDKNKTEKQIQKISDLAQTKLGTQIHQDLSDIDLLQRIVDSELVKMDDTDTQQALGVVLGNVMLADFQGSLEWKIYEDSLGRSRALCVKKTQECLFPITMLSRRMEVGTKPNVQKIYDDAIDMMSEFLPQMPYGGGVLHKLHR